MQKYQKITTSSKAYIALSKYKIQQYSSNSYQPPHLQQVYEPQAALPMHEIQHK